MTLLINFIIALLFLSVSHSQHLTDKKYFGETIPVKRVTEFKPEIFNNPDIHNPPVFSPDGRLIMWADHDTTKNLMEIMFSKFIDGKWSEPLVAPFSGKHWDDGPQFTSDGKKLFFTSKRKPDNDSSFAKQHLWSIDIINNDFSNPTFLNLEMSSPSLSSDDKTFYYEDFRPKTYGDLDIIKVDLDTKIAENVGPKINSRSSEFTPAISLDGKMLVYSSWGRKEGNGLYVSIKDINDEWTDSVNLNNLLGIKEFARFPRFSPCGKYLFFSSGGKVFWTTTEYVLDLVRQ